MGVYFNIAPKIILRENNGYKQVVYGIEHKESHVENLINVAPESNLQWPDGYMYNPTLLYNWKIW